MQDRVIRLEMRLRLRELLPPDLQPDIDDADAPAAGGAALRERRGDAGARARRAGGQAGDGKEIKMRVKNWQADWLRA